MAQDFVGQRVVTSFPCLTKRFFDGLAGGPHTTHIKEVSGSVEAACGLGLADAVVDLVETGTTMRAAGEANRSSKGPKCRIGPGNCSDLR